MNLDIGDKVRFKEGAYSTLKMGTQVEWRLGLEGLIGEVEHQHWRGGTLPDLYRVRVHHPRSGITLTDTFTMDEIEGTFSMGCTVSPSRFACSVCDAPNPITDNAVTGGLSRDPDESRRRLDRILRRNPHGEACDYRGALAECHSLHCPVHGKNKP